MKLGELVHEILSGSKRGMQLIRLPEQTEF
jgi:hypothetical protein